MPGPLAKAADAASKRRQQEALQMSKLSQGAGAKTKTENLSAEVLLTTQLVLDVADALQRLEEVSCLGPLLRDVIKRFLDACLAGRCVLLYRAVVAVSPHRIFMLLIKSNSLTPLSSKSSIALDGCTIKDDLFRLPLDQLKHLRIFLLQMVRERGLA